MHAFGVMFFVGLFLNTIWAQRRGSHGEVQTCRNLESFGAIDEGCSATTPFCVDAKGFGVTDGNTVDHCVYCIHLSQPNSKDQVGVDEGCDDVKRVCTSDRKLKKINQGGTMCAVCVNTVPSDQNPNKFDDGCPPFAPVCVDDGNTRPKSGRLGTACVAQCVDTSVAAKDQGCPDRYPTCTTPDGSDPGLGNPGIKCACTSTSCDDADSCTRETCHPERGCLYSSVFPCLDPFEETCKVATEWTCEEPVTICTQYFIDGGFRCQCQLDVEGNPVCTRHDRCLILPECTTNGDCGPRGKCASTCCPGNNSLRCVEDCALT